MRTTRKSAADDSSAAQSFNQICTIRIELLETQPPIWREVEVPTSITLKVLHGIVQISTGVRRPARKRSRFACATCSDRARRLSTTCTISATRGPIG